QHGVITHRQLISLGMSRYAVSARARQGRLHRLHQGIYAVGHRAPSRERDCMAAVLACGEEAALSHLSAAVHWALLPPAGGPIDASGPSQSGRRKRVGIRLHRCLSLAPAMVVKRDRIPVTTPARTIADLRGTVPEWQWRKAVRQAEFKRLRLGPGFDTDRTR